MFVGVYRAELFLPASHSLKEKRSVLAGIKARLKDLGLSVAEVEGQDLWQRSVLGLAAVSADVAYLDNLRERVRTVLERDPRVTVLRLDRDVRPVDPDDFVFELGEET